jgi:hypothetical protein
MGIICNIDNDKEPVFIPAGLGPHEASYYGIQAIHPVSGLKPKSILYMIFSIFSTF